MTNYAACQSSHVLEHSVRTVVVAVASFIVARWFRLPEAYWAPVTTLDITQSTTNHVHSQKSTQLS
jgi:uncharacterized membrane protein YccC